MGKRAQRNKRNGPAKRVQRKRVNRAPRATATGLVVRGLRTLMGLLPGQVILKPVADFLFGSSKVTGLTRAQVMSGQPPDKPRIYGLQSTMDLSAAAIIADSPEVVSDATSTVWYTNYTKVCLKSITIKAVPTAPRGKRGGSWAIGIEPYAQYMDTADYKTLKQIVEMPMHHLSSYGTTLHLTFVPTARHPNVYGMVPIGAKLIRLYIAFEEPTDGTAYTSEDFGCNVQVSGSVTLCCRGQALGTYDRVINYKAVSVLRTSDGHILSDEDGFERVEMDSCAP